MKKYCLILAMVFFSISIAGAKSKEKLTVNFLGVDFSAVNVLYATESNEKFIEAFKGINFSLLDNSNNFNYGGCLGVKIESIEVKYAVMNLDKLNNRNFTNYDEAELNIESIISEYPNFEGNGLVIIAEKLDKSKARGYYYVVLFDGQTKKILVKEKVEGSASGYGLRNYWNASIERSAKYYNSHYR